MIQQKEQLQFFHFDSNCKDKARFHFINMSIMHSQRIKVNISINDDNIALFDFLLKKARILFKMKGGYVRGS